MSDSTLIRGEIALITQELRELRDLEELVGGLVTHQAAGLEGTDVRVAKVEVEAIDGTKKIEEVYKSWWTCSVV